METAFEEIDFHDDTVVSISVEPSENLSDDKILVELDRHWENRTRFVEFQECGNVSIHIDFDVLRDNAPNNTVGADIERNKKDLVKTVSSFRPNWNVGYEEGMEEPINSKLKEIDNYSLFKLLFFGGVLEVLAKKFSVVEGNST